MIDQMWNISTIINRANQLNPNNIAYWTSRGFTAVPQVSTVSTGWTIFSLLQQGTIIGISSYVIYKGVQSSLPVARDLYNYFNRVHLPTVVYAMRQTGFMCLGIYRYSRMHLSNAAISTYGHSVGLIKWAGTNLTPSRAVALLILINPNIISSTPQTS